MRINALIGAVALTLSATTLAACGSSGGSNSAGAYCTQLKADKAYFESLSGGSSNVSGLGDVFSRVHALAAAAPDNVSADWKTLDAAVTTMENALKDAGIQPSDLAALQSGSLPPNVDPTKLQALVPKLQALSSSKVSDAANRISADAKKSCGIDLSSGS
jgi:hypothetical protein